MQEVRIYFNKTGRAKYISHLDLMRTFTRAVTRAKIPLWYTEGFNPHPFMTFALPLSLGIESVCESVDIRIVEEIANDEIKDRLNSVMPEGLTVTAVSSEYKKCNEIAFAEYEVTFEFDESKKAGEYESVLSAIIGSNELVTKKTAKKHGRKTEVEINLKDYINSFSLSSSGNKTILNIVLAAGNSKNLNISVLLDYLNTVAIVPDFTEILKKRLLTSDLTEFK